MKVLCFGLLVIFVCGTSSQRTQESTEESSEIGLQSSSEEFDDFDRKSNIEEDFGRRRNRPGVSRERESFESSREGIAGRWEYRVGSFDGAIKDVRSTFSKYKRSFPTVTIIPEGSGSYKGKFKVVNDFTYNIDRLERRILKARRGVNTRKAAIGKEGDLEEKLGRHVTSGFYTVGEDNRLYIVDEERSTFSVWKRSNEGGLGLENTRELDPSFGDRGLSRGSNRGSNRGRDSPRGRGSAINPLEI